MHEAVQGKCLIDDYQSTSFKDFKLLEVSFCRLVAAHAIPIKRATRRLGHCKEAWRVLLDLITADWGFLSSRKDL